MGNIVNVGLFILSTLFSFFALTYFKLNVVNIQQILVVLLLIILLSYNKIFSQNKGLTQISQKAMMLVGSLFVQLLVLSSGGFFSPFLVLIHLYTLGASFLVNLSSSLAFLGLTLGLVLVYSQTNAQYHQLLISDIGSVLLYIASFVVIVPLSALVSKYYHLKDSLFNLVSKKFNVIQSQQELLLLGLKELVIITDRDLKVLSANEAFKNMYSITDTDLIHKKLFDLLALKDATGKEITEQDLQVHRVLLDHASRIVNGYYLYPSKSSAATKVIIQIRPVVSQENTVNQLMFILSEDQKQNQLSHQDLNTAFIKQQGIKEQIFNNLSKDGRNFEVVKLFEILNNVDQEIFTAAEIDDHGIKPTNTFPDIAYICKKMVLEKTKLAYDQSVNLSFELPPSEEMEKVRLQLIDEQLTKTALPLSNFSLPVDEKWFRVLVGEVLNLAILLASSSSEKKIKFNIGHSLKGIVIEVFTTAPTFTNRELSDLYTKYYPLLQGKLAATSSSGLEGFLAKEISTRLNIPMQINYSSNPGWLVIQMDLVNTRK
jgi:PAS domain-containing protein